MSSKPFNAAAEVEALFVGGLRSRNSQPSLGSYGNPQDDLLRPIYKQTPNRIHPKIMRSPHFAQKGDGYYNNFDGKNLRFRLTHADFDKLHIPRYSIVRELIKGERPRHLTRAERMEYLIRKINANPNFGLQLETTKRKPTDGDTLRSFIYEKRRIRRGANLR